jgi:two-component system, chemotaxis family, chemotaxis protein CheY
MSGYRFDKLKLLVIDDNQQMRKLISTIMIAFGAPSILEAESAEKAWVILGKIPVDIIMVDWQMEGMNGLEFVKKVRNAPDSPNPFIPIIMLTGHTHIDHVRMARDAGANEFLAKPVSVKGLLSRLISVIENPRPFVRAKDYFGPCRRRRSNAAFGGPERRNSNAVDIDTIGQTHEKTGG